MTGDHPQKLPVLRTIAEVWLFLFRHQREFWRLVWFPLVAQLLLLWVVHSLLLHLSIPGMSTADDPVEYLRVPALVAGGISVLVVACFTALVVVRWHRFVILGERPSPFWQRLTFGRRELLFLLITICVGFLPEWIGSHIGALVSTIVVPPDAAGQPPGDRTATLIPFLFSTAAYLAAFRFYILIPIVAVDGSPSLKLAWRTTKENAIRFIVFFTLSVLPFAVLMAFLYFPIRYASHWLRDLFKYIDSTFYEFVPPVTLSFAVHATLSSLFIGIFAATALSLSYRHLTGMEGTIEDKLRGT